MHRYSGDLLGYAVALFACYGVFMSVGLGRATFSLIFLTLGIAAAMCVVAVDHSWAGVLPSVLGVALLRALGFAGGWGGCALLLQTGLVGTLFGNGGR